MKRLYHFLIIFLVFASCGSSELPNDSLQITGNVKTDLNNLLPQGKVIVDVMDGINQNPRQEELLRKFQMSIKQNYDWFIEYLKTVPEGEPMPYHPNLNLTENEYKELQSFLNNVELISSGKTEMIINKNDKIIEFQATGKLKILELVKIDLNNNVIIIGENILSFSNSVNITTDSNSLKSKWKGYSWKLEDPLNLDLNSIKDLKSLKAKRYKFSIGRLEKTGKTFLSIKGDEYINGTKQVNFELPIIF